jgi:hypothetical protein
VSLTLNSGDCSCANVYRTTSGSASGAPCELCDYTPSTWSIPLGGFTGCFAIFNLGSQQMTATPGAPCVWSYSDVNPLSGTGNLTATLSLSNENVASLAIISPYSGSTVTYGLPWGIVDQNCCDPFQLTLEDAQCGTPLPGTAPASLTLLPSCTSQGGGTGAASGGCPTSLSAVPSCCSGAFSGYVASGGGGGGGGGSASVACCSGTALPGTLQATFGGDLSALGTRPAVWNGSMWAGTGAGCGGVTFTLDCLSSGPQSGAAFEFIMSGGTEVTPGGSIAAATTCSPFLWSQGVAPTGTCGGMGDVTFTQ